MAIQLDEFYRVEHDAACWTLVYEKHGDINPNTGKPKTSRDAAYFPNLKQTLIRYLDESLKGSTEVLDVINRIREVEQNTF